MGWLARVLGREEKPKTRRLERRVKRRGANGRIRRVTVAVKNANGTEDLHEVDEDDASGIYRLNKLQRDELEKGFVTLTEELDRTTASLDMEPDEVEKAMAE